VKRYSEVNSSGSDRTEWEANIAQMLTVISQRLSRLRYLALSLMMVLGFWSTARADVTAISINPVVQLNSGSSDETLGWEFVPTSNLMVTELGLFNGLLGGNAGNPNVFQQAHVVAIWDNIGDLLTSAPMAAGTSAPLIGNFRFVNAPHVLLSAGHHYVIGAYYPSPVSDAFTDRNLGDSSIHFDSNLSFVSVRVLGSPGGITFPTISYSSYLGEFGPNFMFTVVPEPTVFSLFGFGVAALVVFRPRR
jgi:hypothetical protein